MKSGGDFSLAHVAIIARQLRGERIVCLTDVDGDVPGVEMRRLQTPLAGWWAKLEMFAPWQFEPGERIVYFDLDTVIVQRPDRLFVWDGDFAALEDLWNPGRMASGVMAWRAGNYLPGALWRAEPITEAHDGAHIARIVGTHWTPVQTIERGVVSFKPRPRDHHTWRRELDGTERVVCFHGQPRPWDVADQIPWLTPFMRCV